VTIDVRANDDDVDGDTLALIGVEGASHGTASIAPGGTHVSYEPEPDFNGTDTFEYAVSDGNEGTEIGEVVVTVSPVNDPPQAAADTATVSEGASVVLDVVANDSAGPADESGQTLTVASVGTPTHGVAEVVATGPDAGKVRYTPSAGYLGPDSFGYDVSDGSATATGLVSVTVRKPTQKSLCGLTPTISGTLGDDVIEGTPGDDVIRARRGNDVINGNGGDDIVCGGPGADTVTTGAGADRIAGGSGADTLTSGAGDDRVRGGFGKDAIQAGDGDDSVAAGFADDTVDAGDGRNRASGGPGDDHLTAGSGDDRLDGGPGTDTCDADGGRNTVLRCE
jgi:Ca2+-binding RTX toxin-like protein